jgi:hypothetical protein
MKKRWRHDGPQHSSKGWEWHPDAFQGKAYPNTYTARLNTIRPNVTATLSNISGRSNLRRNGMHVGYTVT